MGSNYVRIQSYAPVSHDAHQHVNDLDTDVALSNVVCSLCVWLAEWGALCCLGKNSVVYLPCC